MNILIMWYTVTDLCEFLSLWLNIVMVKSSIYFLVSNNLLHVHATQSSLHCNFHYLIICEIE